MDDDSRKRNAAIRDFEAPEESTNPKKQCEGSEPMPSRQTKSSEPMPSRQTKSSSSNPAKDDDEAIFRLVYRL